MTDEELGRIEKARVLTWDDMELLIDEIRRLRVENDDLRKLIEGHCERIAAQSDALSRKAEK